VIPHNSGVIDVAESAPYRPRLSRETRRLLLTALVAVLTLWALARVRFPDRPPTPNPVPPILGQLTGSPTFADLAARVGELRVQLSDSLVPVVLVDDRADGNLPTPRERMAALRIQDDLAVTLMPPAPSRPGTPLGVVAEDRGSGLTLIQTAVTTRPAVPIFWSPRDLDQPRYVLASSTSARTVSLHPAFIGSLAPMEIAQWTGAVWALPTDVAITPGAVLFSEQGELIGLAARYDAGLVVVPARMLLASAEQLLEAPPTLAADLGIEIDVLTARLAIAAGAETGVVVTWVDPTGIAAMTLRAGDVIQAIDDMEVTNAEQWRVRAARVGVGDTLTLRVTRRGAQRTVQLDIPPSPEQSTNTLGLTMRRVAGVGAEVMRVQRGSAADQAGIVAGDLVTAIDSVTAPTPSQVSSAFASIQRGELLIAAIRRGGAHRVVAVQR
jgi:PDZ domain-containing protein